MCVQYLSIDMRRAAALGQASLGRASLALLLPAAALVAAAATTSPTAAATAAASFATGTAFVSALRRVRLGRSGRGYEARGTRQRAVGAQRHQQLQRRISDGDAERDGGAYLDEVGSAA